MYLSTDQYVYEVEAKIPLFLQKRALKSFGHETNMEEIDESLLLHVTS